MGGGYSLDGARLEPSLRAAVINDGHLVTDPGSIKKIHAAGLVFVPARIGVAVEDVQKFEPTLEQQGKKVAIVIHPDAGHGFESEPQNRISRRGCRRSIEAHHELPGEHA